MTKRSQRIGDSHIKLFVRHLWCVYCSFRYERSGKTHINFLRLDLFAKNIDRAIDELRHRSLQRSTRGLRPFEANQTTPNPADLDSRLSNKMNRAALTLRSTVAASASRRFLSSRALRLQTARSFVTAHSFGNNALFSSHIQGHGALQSIVSAPGAKLQVRGFAESATFLDEKEVEERVLAVVKAFEKVDAAKVTPTSHFARDLGLDSLDAVEVVMAFEEEFVIEIPDAEAENILTCEDAIKFIAAHPQAR